MVARMPITPSSAAEADKPRVGPWDARRALFAALALWVIPMLVVSVIVALRPTHRTVTLDSYHYAAGRWWAGESLYVGPSGMNYLPQFAVLFSPFHALPLWLGEVLWRVVAATALAGGLWRVLQAVFRGVPERPFFWASLMAMPLCLGALRNGNSNALFGGVTLLVIAAILHRRWWLAAGFIALLAVIKPLGLVVLLLAPLVYAPLRGRLLVALVAVALFPFCFASPEYVCSQYRDAWGNLQACAVVTEHRFADINGMLRTFGAPLGPGVSKLVRVLAGGLTAAVWWLGARRLREPLRALWLFALATAYLMLFNPMTEANSFAILAPALGAWAAWFLFDPEAGSARRLGWVLFCMALSMGLLPGIVRPWCGNYFALFWHPFMTLVFLALLGRFVWRAAPPAERQLTAQPPIGSTQPSAKPD
jgi:alpha-1,2-mannosyltransferase